MGKPRPPNFLEVDGLVDVATAAAILGLTPRRVRQLVDAGTIEPAGQLNGGYVFRRADVEALAKSRR